MNWLNELYKKINGNRKRKSNVLWLTRSSEYMTGSPDSVLESGLDSKKCHSISPMLISMDIMP